MRGKYFLFINFREALIAKQCHNMMAMFERDAVKIAFSGFCT